MLEELLKKEKDYLNYFFENLDMKAAEKVLQMMKECQGILMYTGIGKSGLVAEKISTTMTSTGTRALFLSPTNILHGDLGIVTDKDVFILISKSGESEELLSLIPYIRNKGAKIIAIVIKPESRLVKASDLSIHLPFQHELCPYDKAPTVSAVIQMIFGDILAIELMVQKKFSLDQYAMNHPAGRIGKLINLRVKDLMITGPGIPTCSPGDKLIDTLVELSNKRCGCVLILDANNILLGIFTDGDLRRSLQDKGTDALQTTMQQLMTKTPRTAGPNVLAAEAVKLMEGDQKNPITVLAVVDDSKKVVGIIKMHDILQTGI